MGACIVVHNILIKALCRQMKDESILFQTFIITGESKHWLCTCNHGSGVVQVINSLGLFISLNEFTILEIANIYSAHLLHQKFPPCPFSSNKETMIVDCFLSPMLWKYAIQRMFCMIKSRRGVISMNVYNDEY